MGHNGNIVYETGDRSLGQDKVGHNGNIWSMRQETEVWDKTSWVTMVIYGL